jgi:hypothetical protein
MFFLERMLNSSFMYVEVRQLGVHEFFLILSIAVHESLKETRERYQYGDRQSETVHAITVQRVAGNPALSAIRRRPRGRQRLSRLTARPLRRGRISPPVLAPALRPVQTPQRSEKENSPRAGQARQNLETEFWR